MFDSKFILDIRTGNYKCASRCRLCQLLHTKTSGITLKKYIKIINKFYDFKEDNKLEKMHLNFWNGYALNSNLNDFSQLFHLHEKVGEWQMKGLHLGGVIHMDSPQLYQWLYDRKQIGSEFTSASYFGYDEIHNYWSNRKNNFQFLLNAQKLASEVGLYNEVHIFLLNSTISNLPILLDTLGTTIMNIRDCIAFPPYYSGLARRYEPERLSMENLDALPTVIKAIFRRDYKQWKSEQEWIEYVRNVPERDSSYMNHFTLELNGENIDKIEKMKCDEIINDLFQKTQQTYQLLPTRVQLADKYSDKTNEKVYMHMWDMESLWLDRYLKEYPTIFDRKLTYFGR